jgi:hypothetical protein
MRIKKTDPLTGEVFSGKPNQRFKSAFNRVRFNNDKAIRHRKKVNFINKPLNTNIKVLERLMKDDEQKEYHKEFLRGSQIDLNICTHFVSDKGTNYPCIYHYMIKPMGENMVLIKKLKSDR